MQGEGKQASHHETAFKRAVCHPKRLEMLGYLAAGKESGTEEDELADVLGLALPLVKYHLGVLRSAHLVTHAEDAESGTTARYVVVLTG